MHKTVHLVLALQILCLKIQTVYIIYTIITNFPIFILYKQYIYTKCE